MLQRMTDSDVFRIETLTSYPDNHMKTIDIAKKGQQGKARPEVKTDSLNMDDYDTVIFDYLKMEYGFNCALCA